MVCKQVKNISSVTLGLVLLLALAAWSQEISEADQFNNFKVQPEVPYVDSISAYHLTFDLSKDAFGRLHKGRLIFEFPSGFGLETVDSVIIGTDHPKRKFKVDSILVSDGTKLIVRLEEVVEEGVSGVSAQNDKRVNLRVGIFSVRNPQVALFFQIMATAHKRGDLMAGPSLSDPFEIIGSPVGPKAELQVISTELISPNSPKVNTGQAFTILTRVANTSSFAAQNVLIALSSDGQSIFDSLKTIDSISGGDTVQALFEITAASESGTENFETNITSENVVELEPFDNSATAIIQTPAYLLLTTSIADGDTIFVAGGQEYTFTFSITNAGESSVGRGHFIFDAPNGVGAELIVGTEVIFRATAPPFNDVKFHSLEITEIPLDLNTLQPAPISDTEVQFTVVVGVEGVIDFEDSFIIQDNPFNPLNGTNTFVYTLTADSDVEFRIFTITGLEVYARKYSAGSQGGKSGTNQIQWDGRNESGEIVLNGVYVTLLNVLATGETATLKLAVLK